MIKTTRKQTIATLIRHRDAIGIDLATMPGWKQGTAWHLDRQRELDRTWARMAALGAAAIDDDGQEDVYLQMD